MKRPFLLLLLFALALAPQALPASESVLGSAGAAFPAVQAGASARAIGMGSTYVGIAEGSASLLWNPAGLADLRSNEVAIHHSSSLLGMSQEIAVIGLPLGTSQGLGLSLSFADGGAFEGRNALGAPTGDYGARAYGASLGWGIEVPGDLALGLTAKMERQELAGQSADAFAGDLGLLWSPSPAFRLGASYSNLGSDVVGKKLAQGLRLGLSSYLDKGRAMQWLLAASLEALVQGDQSVHVSLEGSFYRALAARAGYIFQAGGAAVGTGLAGWTLGAGLKVGSIDLDYAFIPVPALGNTHRLSLSYAFGERRSDPAKASAHSLGRSNTVVPATVVVLYDQDFVAAPAPGAEALSQGAQERLHKGLREISGVSGAILRVNGMSERKAVAPALSDRREKLVRSFLYSIMPGATVSSVTSPNSESANAAYPSAIFRFLVR